MKKRRQPHAAQHTKKKSKTSPAARCVVELSVEDDGAASIVDPKVTQTRA